MNFVAIDFETANEKRSSPCAIGLTVIKDNQVVEEYYRLIKPKEMRFAPMNIMVHGIRPGDVVDASEFDVLWEEIKPYLENNIIVAHNASFDISVLRNTLDLYNLPYPDFNYCCTLVMSKLFFPYLENAKLNTVSAHLGHSFMHHEARADATACANILVKIAEELGVSTIEEVSNLVGFQMGQVFDRGYTPSRTTGGNLTSKRFLMPTSKASKGPSLTTTFFKNKYVAFTGPLESITRSKAIHIIEDLGGDYTPSVTKKTNVVITNVKEPFKLSPEQMSTKMRRAMKLIEGGQEIIFLNEEEFLNL